MLELVKEAAQKISSESVVYSICQVYSSRFPTKTLPDR